MLDLNVIREQIDGIDKQLVDLFEQRMKLTKEVAEYKIQTGKKVLDTQRERAKIEAVTKLVKNEANVHAIDDLFSQIMANSRKGQYQLLEAMGQTLREPYEAIESINKEGVKIVYQGVPGAYTQEAACNFFGEDCDNYGVPTWRDVMNEFQLKYGCNPNQKPSRIFMEDGSGLPVEILNGRPGYINFLDAFNGYQLVKELKEATGLPAATSFKHVSPAGAAVGLPLSEVEKKIYWVDESIGELSPLACAYARARGADRMSSFGDFISLSDECDASTAKLIQHEVSDGIIAPGFTDEALEILKGKKKGNYNIIKIDPSYRPAPVERKQVYGVTFEQGRNEFKINEELLENVVTENKEIPKQAKIDLIIALITLKYTQSNSVCYAKNGQAIGIGAGHH
jgi:monofunctional chorismate mutase